MRITLDIPDQLHSKLANKVHQEGITVNALILRSIQAMLEVKAKPAGVRKPPVIESERPGSLRLDNTKIFELIDFP